MKKFFAIALLLPALSIGQQKSSLPETEQKDLSKALSESGNSPIDFIRSLEKHLEKYPNSSQRPDFELAIAQASVEAKDPDRTIKYGERVLARDPENAQMLDRVSRALLYSDDKDKAERALKYSKKLEGILLNIEKQGLPAGRNQAQLADDLDRSIGRTLVFQARATGNLGKIDEAIALAKKSFERYPTAESAREVGRWLMKSGKNLEAVEYYADAFTIQDRAVTDVERARDRARMAELYVKEKKSEVGLGDLMLAAYDRMAALAANREAQALLRDPNLNRTNIMDFTLTSIDGKKLALTSLKGKVVVLDFWATWCGPCRTQYPLYQQVKQRFASNSDVVFLGINTDDDHSVVKPFLEDVKWSKDVYFEDGLQNLLKVNSIPATVVINKEGQIVSRMNGFLPDRFVEMLSERINDALGVKPAPQSSAALQK
jgi:thiol-disulfide isomerase/thioredoxin